MHDLLNDLAKYISGDICFRFGVDRAKRTLKETRHISFVNDDYRVSCNEYENLYDAIRLRTFLPVTRISFWSWYCETLTLELIFKLKCLHVLSFCGCVNLKEVPETMGDLMHLRFLDLSNIGITGQFHHRPQQQCFQLTSYISSFLLPPQTSLQ